MHYCSFIRFIFKEIMAMVLYQTLFSTHIVYFRSPSTILSVLKGQETLEFCSLNCYTNLELLQLLHVRRASCGHLNTFKLRLQPLWRLQWNFWTGKKDVTQAAISYSIPRQQQRLVSAFPALMLSSDILRSSSVWTFEKHSFWSWRRYVHVSNWDSLISSFTERRIYSLFLH